MLVFSRAPGESLLIGESLLGVQEVGPPARLVLVEDGKPKAFEFSRRQIASTPTITLKEARVMVQRIQRGRVVLAIDAPRHVSVVKGELAGKGESG